MSHQSQLKFFSFVFESLLGRYKEAKVIDIGSLDINGGPHKLLTSDISYVGVDLGPGPNVDLVCAAQYLDLPSQSFDVAMSSECFEHNRYWRETIFQMLRLVRPGGLVVFTCAGAGRPIHGTSESDNFHSAPLLREIQEDYYANVSAKDIKRSIGLSDWFSDYLIIDDFKRRDTLFVGIKRAKDVVKPDIAFETLRLKIDQEFGVNSKIKKLVFLTRHFIHSLSPKLANPLYSIETRMQRFKI